MQLYEIRRHNQVYSSIVSNCSMEDSLDFRCVLGLDLI